MSGALVAAPAIPAPPRPCVRRGAAAFRELVRTELRGARPLILAALQIAALGSAFVHHSVRVTVEPFTPDGLLLVLVLAAAAALPLVADVLADRRRAADALAGLPVGPRGLGLARFTAVLVALLMIALPLVPLDALAHFVFVTDVPRPDGSFELDGPLVRHVAAMTSIGLAATALLAAALRHGLGAVLGSLVLVGWIAVVDALRDGRRPTRIQEFAEWVALHPGAAAAAAALLVLAPLFLGVQTPRGRTGRKVGRRVALVLTPPLIAATVGFGFDRSRYLVPPLRTWDDAADRVRDIAASPDGRWVAVVIEHQGPGAPRNGLWMVDALDGSVRQVDDGFGYFGWLRTGAQVSVFGGSWTPDSKWIATGGRVLDPVTGEARTITDPAESEAIGLGGWRYEGRTFHEDGSKEFTVRFGDGPPCSYRVLRCFSVPRAAGHLVFHGHPSGEIRVLDVRSGTTRDTGLSWSGKDLISAGDHGRGLIVSRREEVRGESRSWIVDLETLQQCSSEPDRYRHVLWIQGPGIAMRWDLEQECWFEVFGEQRRRDLPERISRELVGGRWLTVERSDAIRILEADGQVWRTVRQGGEENNDA